jgi:hypothetical protein
MKKILLLLLAATFFLVASAPTYSSSKRSQAKLLETVQFKYASAIRWSEFEMAWSHVDPAYRDKNPLSDLEKERFKQIQITGYDKKTQDFLPDGSVEQSIEIRLINRNTQTERIVMDIQVWRWDEKAKRWWLTTGLPSFSAKSF